MVISGRPIDSYGPTVMLRKGAVRTPSKASPWIAWFTICFGKSREMK